MRTSRSAPSAESVRNPDGHIIGLDIGATAVRAAILAPVRDDDPDHLMTVEDLGEAALPEGAVIDGIVVEPATVTRVLAELWKTANFGCRQVIVGVSSSQAVVRLVTMPNLPPDQLAKALPFQAREVIALPLDKAVLDFRPLERDPGADGDEDTIDGLLVATPKQPVLTAVRAVEAAGLRVARVDLSSFAALRAAATPGLEAEAVVDIGAQVTNVIIHRHGVPRVVRTLGRGGQMLTDKLAERTGASATEAEILKREIGLLGSESEAAIILSGAVRPLVSDIRSSVQYFATTNSSVTLRRISLTGGGAELPGLAEMLTNDVGVPCEIVSPLRHVRNGVEPSAGVHLDDGDRYQLSAVAVGLALGAAA